MTTTPPPQFSDHPIHSTPQSQGTAADAENHFDTRTLNSQNIRNINHDLHNTGSEVDLIKFLKGFYLLEHLGPDRNLEISTVETKVESLRCQAETDFNTALGDAVLFCNSANCSGIKDDLLAYCRPSHEPDRYQPLVDLLNKILRIDNDNPDVIFLVNDPGIIEVPGLSDTLRKPDIILVLVTVLKSWLGKQEGECNHYSFADCVTHIDREGMPNTRRSWLDILQFWELKANLELLNRISEIGSTKFVASSIIDKLAHSQSSAQPSAMDHLSTARGSNSVKATNTTGSKRKKHPEDPVSESKRSRLLDNSPHSIRPEVQCAYYALERFRSSWQISHVIGVLLKDTGLEVYWYDSQGHIKSHQIDIITHLPLLLVLIQVTCQHCLRHPSGLLESAKIPEGYESIEVGGNPGRRFQLVGRMTYGCNLVARTPPPMNPGPSTQVVGRMTKNSTGGRAEKLAPNKAASSAARQYFFKISWPEDKRLKEADIIGTIPDKIQKLDKQYHPFIVNHIPHIVEANTVSGSSTAIIRIVLELPTEGSRTQYWMISRRLESLNSHLSDENFHQIYWEIIRCHRLLWAAGVAHGDISFNNLMYNPETRKGILNDFDLATVMQPGTEYPPQTGCRRTGTKAFMALELLLADGVSGVTLRHYRHELESFAWVLLYAAVKNRSKPQGLDFFHQTLDKSTYDEIFLSKTGVLGNLSRLGEYTDFDCLYAQPLLDTLKLWAELLINSNPKPEEVFGNKRKKIKEIVLSDSLLITRALKAWPDHQEEDSSWIDAKVNA